MGVILSYTIELEDPAFTRRSKLFRQNGEWASEHSAMIYAEQHRGKYVAISECELFVSADAQEAERLAKARHPADEPYVIYVPLATYARIYRFVQSATQRSFNKLCV